VETKAGKIRMAKAKGGRDEKRNRKEKRRKGMMEVKKVAEEWEIWDEEEKVVNSEAEVKKLVPEKFHRWIKIFDKKQLERMSTWKL